MFILVPLSRHENFVRAHHLKFSSEFFNETSAVMMWQNWLFLFFRVFKLLKTVFNSVLTFIAFCLTHR
jgi:hypothetical protein